MSPQDELEKLKAVCPEAELWDENGKPLVYMPDCSFFAGGKSHKMDILLSPRKHDSGGYPTRLFFHKKVSEQGNWNMHSVKGRTWHACSWDNVRADQPWMDILAAHLRSII